MVTYFQYFGSYYNYVVKPNHNVSHYLLVTLVKYTSFHIHFHYKNLYLLPNLLCLQKKNLYHHIFLFLQLLNDFPNSPLILFHLSTYLKTSRHSLDHLFDSTFLPSFLNNRLLFLFLESHINNCILFLIQDLFHLLLITLQFELDFCKKLRLYFDNLLKM